MSSIKQMWCNLSAVSLDRLLLTSKPATENMHMQVGLQVMLKMKDAVRLVDRVVGRDEMQSDT